MEDEIDDDALEEAIESIEEFLFNKEGEDSGEKLFKDFAKENKKVFANASLGYSTENNFEFTDLHKKFQTIYEQKLEKIISKHGITSQGFFNGLSKRCQEGDQEIILFVDILDEIINYKSFIEMMANLINKV